MPFLQKREYKARPIDSNYGPFQTYSSERLLNIQGINYYKAKYGVETKPYGVFWVQINKILSDGTLIVSNMPEKGRLSIDKVKERVESDLLFPAIRGSDIKRWITKNVIFTILQHEKNGKPLEENYLKINFPRTYAYLIKFKQDLLNVNAKSTKKTREQKVFYAMFGIDRDTFSNFKVVWGYMNSDIFASVISDINTGFSYKRTIPLYTTCFFPMDNEYEAHYLCSIINSTPVRDFIKSFSSAGRGFGTPSVMEHVGIPKFDPQNALHLKLAEISKQCHQLKLEGKDEEIKKLEKENDALVEELFGISHE